MTQNRIGMERGAMGSLRASALSVGALSLALLLAGCSSTSASAPTSTTTPTTVAGADKTACALIAASDVRTTVGAMVEPPRAVVQGAETSCTYRASPAARSVIIHYNTAWSNQDFNSNQSSLTSQGQHITTITGLGDTAFSATTTTAGYTVNTVVAAKGALGILVTSTAPLAKVENLTELIISKVTAGESTTTTSP